MDKNNTNKIDQQGKSRRSFIKKSSVVAGVSVLPASNVWGTCNVSGVSGGSQAINSSCVVAPFTGGYGPSFWQRLTQYNPSERDNNALASLLADVSKNDKFSTGPKAYKYKSYYPYVRTMLDNHVIQLQGGGKIPPLNVNVGNTMRNASSESGKVKHIVAVYINSIFGFTNLEAQFTGNDGLALFIEHVWGSLHEGSYANTMSVLRGSYTSLNTINENQLSRLLRKNNVL